MALKLMYITNSLDVALIAQKYGVDRIWIDLELIDKEERQRGLDVVKSHHTIADIRKIKPYLTSSIMLVRINHWNEESKKEIEAVIDAGADMIMLPYWKTVDEVSRFLDAVDGRCATTLLLETKEAVCCVDEVLKLRGVDEIHIGLNDLHLSYGLDFMFQLLTNGTIEMLCKKIGKAGIPYGFGGIAKIGEGAVPAERIIMEHYRLGSTRAILSRTFCNIAKMDSVEEVESVFRNNIKKLREYEKLMENLTDEEFLKNKIAVRETVNDIVNQIKMRRN